MTVTRVDRDDDNLTIALIADFDASIREVWELWSDPRKLERWMGPPNHPASVELHDLTPGGEIRFSMVGPDGDRSWGSWRVTAVEPPASLAFTDVFVDSDGAPLAGISVSEVTVRLAERDGGTRMEVRSTYESREGMDQRLGFGEPEGWRAAVGQMDALL
jgi:uncharacterized protein YndB with AHSA1/START domain